MFCVRQVDIARKLRISQQAVAFALSDRPAFQKKLHPETRRRILSAVRRMGYVPNSSARSLKLGKTHTVIMATREAFHHPYVHELVEELQIALAAQGYQMMLESLQRVADEAAVYRSFVPGRCDAVVMLQLPASARGPLVKVQRRGLPVIAIEPGPVPGFTCIDYDRAEAVRMGVAHLLGQGHRRVALVFDALRGVRRQQRLRGYRAALKQFKIEFDEALLFPQPVEADAGELWRQMAVLQPRPTAVFCYNDEVAARFLAALRKARVRVPADVALVAQGNSRLTALVEVPLTAVDTNHRGIAQAVVDALLARFKNGQAPPRQIQVKPFLVERASSGTRGDR
ncbi:MAG: LacI family DNA-binding transcriptional regulator [Verrucomicrobia bacterium]|nr:LacI family DNA-binding transcriptional regulator [Verrucomicrobiota bacterium]